MPIDFNDLSNNSGARLNAQKATMPRVPGQGFGPKLTGRVAPDPKVKLAATKEIEMEANQNIPVEFQTSGVEKQAFALSPGVARVGRDIGLSALTGLGAMALTSVGGMAMDHLKTKFIDSPALEQSFKRCLELEPQLKSYPQAELHEYFMLVAEASPSVAKNPLLASQYLRYLVDYKGTANFTAFNDLAKLQGQLNDNKAGNNPYSDAFGKGLMQNTAKRIIDPDYKRLGKN